MMSLLALPKRIMGIFGFRSGRLTMGYIRRLTQVIIRRKFSRRLSIGRRNTSSDTAGLTKYRTWQLAGVKSWKWLIYRLIWRGQHEKLLTLFPYLNEKPKGASYVANAFLNYLIIGGMIYMIIPLFQSKTRAVQTASGGAITNPAQVVGQLQVFTPVPTEYRLPTVTPVPTYTPYPTYTPAPTYTAAVPWGFPVSPTVTKVPFLPEQVDFVFSYYNPDLVRQDFEEYGYAVNCHPDNLLYNPSGSPVGCKDTTASGLPWSRWRMYRTDDKRFIGGVAVPYYPATYNPLYPLFSVVTVSAPAIIAGDYLVIDICPACDDYVTEHGVLFLDFNAEGLPSGVNFWTEVQVSNVLYPWEWGNDVSVPVTVTPVRVDPDGGGALPIGE